MRTDYNKKRSYSIERLRLRIVFYNKYNSDEEIIGIVIGVDLRFRSNIIIVVSINIKILDVRRIIKEIYRIIKGRRDKLTVWINQDGLFLNKKFENYWDLVIKSSYDEVARR